MINKPKDTNSHNKNENQGLSPETIFKADSTHYEVFINASSDMMFIKDDHFRYLTVNNAIARFFDRSKAEMIGKTDWELADDHTITPCKSSDERAINSKSAFVIHEKLGNRYCETTKFSMTLPNGQKGIGGIIRDITEQREAEEESLRLTEELIEMGNRAKVLLESIPDLIFILNQEGIIIDYHTPDEELLFISPEGFMNKHIRNSVPKEIANITLAAIEKLFHENKPQFYKYSLMKHGRTHYFDARMAKYGTDKVFVIVRDITLHHEIEKKIEEQKRQLSSMVNHLPGFVYRCLTYECCTTLYISDKCKDITGYTSSQFTSDNGITINNIINPTYQQAYANEWQRALATKSKFEFRYQITTAQNKDRWVWERGEGIFDDNGELLFLEGYIEDITERRQEKEKLHNAQAILSAIVENTFDSIWSINTQYEIVYINKVFANAFLAAFNVSLEPGSNLLHALPNEIQPVWKKRYDQVLNGERIVFIDVVKAIDANIYIEVAANPIKQGDEIIGASLFGRDITQKKIYEKALLESQARINSIFRSAPVGIGLLTNRVIQKVNERFCDITGYSEAEVLGKSARMLYPSDEEYDFVGHDKYDQIKAKGTGTVETLWQKKDGTIINVLLSSTPIDVYDISNGVTFTALDISERKKVEKELIKAKERAEESDRLKSAFLANMSHEIRTPMNSIMGFASLLPEEDSKELLYKYANIIVRNSEQLVHIIDDIVLYSRLQAKSLLLRQKIFDVCELLHDLKQSFSLSEFQKGIELLTENRLDCPCRIKTDYDKLRQVYMNLISNAFKYTKTGTICFGAELKKGQTLFFVSDTGIGIPKGETQQVFERFFRGSNTSKESVPGTGLGLSIVKELVELLGGKIWVESEEGKGSTFYFTIYNYEQIRTPQ